jgi:aryl-alcohol dehydrogenase-like predicted oxidoreductase
MRMHELGELRVPAVGVGASKFGSPVDAAGVRAIVDAAIDTGATFFDTADVYGGGGESERLLGEAVRGRRDEVLLATKFGMSWGGEGEEQLAPGSRGAVRRAVEGSLARLGTDRIDLYQYHLPDGVTPLEETLGALDALVREGKVRHIGCCNFSAAQLEGAAQAAQADGLTPVVSIQNEYSLLARGAELEVLPACERLGVALIPYFPLASGLLTGKYHRGAPGPAGAPPHARGGPGDDPVYDRLEALGRFAAARGIEPAQAAIRALAARPAVATVIAGATSAEQLRANASAAAWEPSQEELTELDELFPLVLPPRPEPPPAAASSEAEPRAGLRQRLRRRLRRR